MQPVSSCLPKELHFIANSYLNQALLTKINSSLRSTYYFLVAIRNNQRESEGKLPEKELLHKNQRGCCIYYRLNRLRNDRCKVNRNVKSKGKRISIENEMNTLVFDKILHFFFNGD